MILLFLKIFCINFQTHESKFDCVLQCHIFHSSLHFKLFTVIRKSFLYARLKNGCIMLYPSASVCLSIRPSVRLSVNFFVSV